MKKVLQFALVAACALGLQGSEISAGDRFQRASRVSDQVAQIQAPVEQVSLYDHFAPNLVQDDLGYTEVEWTYLILLEAGLPEADAFRIAVDSLLFADFDH